LLLPQLGPLLSVGATPSRRLSHRTAAGFLKEGEMADRPDSRRWFQPPGARQADRCAFRANAIGLAATIALLVRHTVASEAARIGVECPYQDVAATAAPQIGRCWSAFPAPKNSSCAVRDHRARTPRDRLVNYALPAEQVLPKATEIAQGGKTSTRTITPLQNTPTPKP